jgi:hypothetical protein
MHAVASDSTVPERAVATRTVVYTTLYDLIARVDEAIEPGEEACVAPIVAHLLCAGRAQFLSHVDHVDMEMLWDDQALACLEAEQSCVPA